MSSSIDCDSSLDRPITEEDPVQRALRDRQLRTLFETALDGMAIADDQGSYLDVNPAACELFGLERDELLGRCISNFAEPGFNFQAAWQEFQQQGKVRGEFRLVRADGEIRIVEFAATANFLPHRHLSVMRDITERKQAEAKVKELTQQLDGQVREPVSELEQTQAQLRESQQRLESILNSVEGVVWSIHPETFETIYINPAVEQIFGCSVAEFFANPNLWFELIHPDDQSSIANVFVRLKEHGKTRTEYRIIRRDGQVRWLSVNSYLVYDKTGKPIRIDGITTDITDRKTAELELEQFFSLALDLLCIADFSGYFRRLNRAWETILGYSIQELEGQLFLDLVHPDDIASTLEVMSELSEQNPVLQFTNRYLAKDGNYRYIEWRCVPYGDLIYAAARDITERKEAEAKILEITQLQQAILDGANYTIISTDTNGIIKTINAAAQKSLGYSSAEAVDQLSPAIFHDLEEIKQRAAELTAELGKSISPGFEVFTAKANLGMLDEHEWTHICKDGSRFPVQLSITALRDQEGTITGLLGIANDITARKQAEAKLQEISERLSLALKSGGIGCWEWDIVQNTLLWDDRMYELYGANKNSDAKLAYEIWSNGLHPDDRDAVETLIRQAVLGEAEYDTEFRVIHPDGSIHFLKAFGIVQHNAEGNPQKMIGVNFDISDRKQAEILLEQSQKRYETLAEASPIGVYLTDANGDCLYVNQTWSQTTGLTKEQAIGPDWSRTLHPEDRERVFKEWYETALVKQQFQSEYRFLRPDSSIAWVIGQAFPLIDSEGEIEGYVGTITDISDRKQAEINLRQNEQKYYQILDAITDMVLVKGPKSRIVWANKAFRDYYAMTNEQLQDMIDAPFNEPDYTLQYIRDDAHVFETGQTLEIEEPVTRYDGKVQIFNTIKSAIRNEAGEKILTVGVSRDISDRKQAEDALRASEEKLRSLFDLCPVGIALNDMQGHFLEVNSAAETIYGYSLEELNQLSYLDLTPEKYADEETRQLELLNTIGRFGPYQKEYIRRDGSLFPVELLGVLVTGKDGNQYIWSIIVDITERKRQEQALRLIVEGTAAKTGEEFFKSCVQYLAQVLEVRYAVISEFADSEKSSAKTLAFWAGDDFCDNFTYSLVGTPCKNVANNTEVCRYPNSVQHLFPEDDYLVAIQAESYAGLSIIDTAGNYLGLLTVLDTKPMVKDLEMQSAILKIFATRAGAEIGRIKAEAAVRQSEIQLRLQSEELAGTLKKLQNTQTQLIQAEKMSSLGQLVAGIAHEINNPVSFIYGNIQPAADYASDLIELIQLYQEHYPSPPQAIADLTDNMDFEYLVSDFSNLLESMKTGATRISDIVKSLRTFSRLDEADLKPINIHENIESTLVILQNRLHGRVGKLEIHLTQNYGKLPLVECYGGLLNQVFLNLLVNAIDAIEQQRESLEPTERLDYLGEITITTSINSENQVFISIHDNGCGMSPEVQEKIFNPFFTTKPVGKGTGMGLATSYQIITENHQGSLRCFSTLGQGTEFRIELPVGQYK